ncbi:unnamed protein product, partial [Rotaria magnacalcarata]
GTVIVGTNVYSICVEKHHFQKLAKSILRDKDQDLSSIPAVRHGILSEEICRRRYVLEQTKKNICSATHPCELVVDPTASYLCCSPHATVVEVVNSIVSYGIFECKCVYAEPGATWNDLISSRESFCLERKDDKLQLRSDHAYYLQLIALSDTLDLNWIDTCILKGQDVYVRRLIHDEEVSSA